MPAAILINEDFESYTPGASGYPTFFTPAGIVFFPTFVDLSNPATSHWVAHGNLFGNGTKAYFWDGTIEFVNGGPSPNGSVFWGSAKDSDNAQIFNGGFAAASVDFITHSGPTLFKFTYNLDGSLSFEIPGNAPATFFGQVFNFNDWLFHQLNFSIGTTNVAGVPFITVSLDISVNGILLITRPNILTNIRVSSCPAGAGVNSYSFQSLGINGSYIDNITIYNDLVAPNAFPHGGFPNIRLSQAVAETIALPDASVAQIRASQMNAEVIKLPDSANLRVSQMVIELIRKTALSGSGWKVYEA